MNWRLKALIQNLVAALPSDLSYATYYWLQRKMGGLRSANPMSRLGAGIQVARYIHRHGLGLESKVFLEIGTGHQIGLPMALWLCGASAVITVDLNPYLKEELVFEDIAYLRAHREDVMGLFQGVSENALFQERLKLLVEAEKNLARLLEMMNVTYLSPADAAQLGLGSGSIDYHVSFTVLEHIPPVVIEGILREGRRLLKPGGLLLHYVDFSDHFAQSDSSIPAINFLKYSDRRWASWSGNRYMYHNRLRVDDFTRMFQNERLRIIDMDATVDDRSRLLLENGFPLDTQFQAKDVRTNATIGSWIVASVESGECFELGQEPCGHCICSRVQ